MTKTETEKHTPTLTDCQRRYITAWKRADRKNDARRQVIEAKQAEVDAMQHAVDVLKAKPGTYPDMEKTLQPIIEAVKVRLGAKGVKRYGPHGICFRYSYYFLKSETDDDSKQKRGDILGALYFDNDGHDGFSLRDFSKDTDEFSAGTMGELNGMNHPRVEMLEAMTFDWLVKFAKAGA